MDQEELKFHLYLGVEHFIQREVEDVWVKSVS